MSKQPFFSIITCAKNSGNTLEKTILSISSQSFKNFEHIVIYSESSDNTLQIINKYFSTKGSNRILFKTPSRGISNAMNIGINKSSGKYLIHLHSDDCFYNNKVLENIHKFLINHQDLDWIYGKINSTNGFKSFGIFPKNKIFQRGLPWLIKYFNYIPHQASFIKKTVFDRFGNFEESLKITMDYEYWLRICRHTNYGFVDLTISSYLVNNLTKSGNPENIRKAIVEKHNSRRKYLNSIELLIADIFEYVSSGYYRSKYTRHLSHDTHN